MNKEPMLEADVLQAIGEGRSAHVLLSERCPTAERRFNRLCKTMVDLLRDIQKEFPDARYYTASGGFNLMLGNSHDFHQEPQQELVALGGTSGVSISDGDF